MTYAVGSTILASDINSWLSTINTLYGVGNGDRGYGQTSAQAAVASGNTITSAQWTNLRAMIANLASHQGVSAANLVPSSVLASGQIVTAETNSTAPHNYDIDNMVTAVDTNRLNNSGPDFTLSSNTWTVTKSTSWSTTLTTIIDVQFGTEDAARYFFNSGGEIRIRLTATSTLLSSSAAQDVDWRDVITNKVGTFSLKARSTTRSGTAGVIANGGRGGLGFYGLDGTPTTIYNGTNIGGTGYTTNDVLILAEVISVSAVNGGNGTGVRFHITVNDDHTNVNYDSVSAGLTANFDILKMNTGLFPTAIASPTYATQQAWA